MLTILALSLRTGEPSAGPMPDSCCPVKAGPQSGPSRALSIARATTALPASATSGLSIRVFSVLDVAR